MKITDISKKYDISVDALRYYEKIGIISPVIRNKSGVREYSEADFANTEFVKCMRGADISIKVLAEYIGLCHQGDKNIVERKAMLIEQRKMQLEKLEEDHLCTHEGSALGRSVSDIKKLCPGSIVLKGLAVRDGSINSAGHDISEWLQELGMIK